MEHTVTILHLSDLQARGPREAVSAPDRRAIQEEVWLRNLDELLSDGPIDLVCLTGDLAHSGKADEYEEAGKFLKTTLRRLGLPDTRLFLIPGNHDIDRGVEVRAWQTVRRNIHRYDDLEVSRWLAGQETPFGFTDDLREKLLRRQAAFQSWLSASGWEHVVPQHSRHGRLGFCSSLQLPKRPFDVHVIGLDSAWLCGDDSEKGRLRLTEGQVMSLTTDRIGRQLPGLRLALVHHALSDLADETPCRRILSGHVDLLLRGQLHDLEPTLWADPEQSLRQIVAGPLHGGNEEHPPACSSVVITVRCNDHGHPQRYELRCRAFSSREGRWIDDGSQYGAPSGRLTLEAPIRREQQEPVVDAPGRFFVGRHSELRRLTDALLPPPEAEPLHPVVLVGPGGVGKTALAAQFFSQHSDRFPGGLLKLSLAGGGAESSEPEELSQQLADLIGMQPSGLSLNEALRGRLRHPRSLLLIEDVDSEAAARGVAELVNQFPECPILITGRLPGLGNSQGWVRIQMAPLEEGEALTLLSAEIAENDYLAEDKRELVRALHYSPLAIQLAAGHLRSGRTPSGLLQLLKEAQAGQPDDPAGPFRSRPAEERTLQDVVQLAPALLRELFGSFDSERMVRGLSLFAWLPTVPVGADLGASVTGLTGTEFERLMSEARRLSLVDQQPGPRTSHRMHQLVAQSLRRGNAEQRLVQERLKEWFLLRLQQLPPERAAEQKENWDALHTEREVLSEWLGELPAEQAPEVVRIGNYYAQLAGPFQVWARLCERSLRDPGLSEHDREPLLLLLCITLEKAGQTQQAEQRIEELCAFARRRNDRQLLAIGRSQLAVVLVSRGQTDTALRILRDEVLPVYDAIRDVRSRAISLSMVASILSGQGHLDEALRINQDEVVPVFKQLGDLHSYAVGLARIADIRQAQGQLDEALRIRTEQVLPIYDQLADVGGRAQTLGAIAEVYAARGQLDEALRIYREEALPVFEKLGNSHVRAITLGRIASIHQVRGQLDEALRIYKDEVLPVFDATADIREHALALNKVASILQSKGQLAEALRLCCEEVLPLYEKLGDVLLRAVTKGQIADVYRGQGRLDEALRVRLEEELPTYEKLGDIRRRAIAMGKLANIYQDKEEFDKALQLRMTEELPYYRQLGLIREQALAMARIAGIRQRQGDLDEAERILKTDVLPVFEKHGYLRSHAVALRQLAGVFKQRGQLDAAVDLLETQVLPRLEQMQIAPPLARARYVLAQALLSRNKPGDRERARDALEKAYASLAPQGIADAERIRSLQLRHGFLRTSVLPLKSALIENARSITRMEIPLHPRLTVLYGKNAAGKTTVLDSLAFGLSALCRLLEGPEGGTLRGRWQSLLRLGWPSGDATPLMASYCRTTLFTEKLSWSETLWRPDRERSQASTDSAAPGTGALAALLQPTLAAIRSGKGGWDTLPVIAYYGVERAVERQAQDGAKLEHELRRLEGSHGGLDAQSRFRQAVNWFYTMEARERKERETRKDVGYRSTALDAVRRVLEQTVPGCRNPRMSDAPERLLVDFVRGDGSIEVLDLSQLSGGYRTHLALVLDLARRMMQANPPPPEPQPGFLWGTEAAAIVLIDEIDLHLHPAWQQTVLPSLLSAFPNAQFIVTTHSDQVLSSCPVDSVAWELLQTEGTLVVRPPKVPLPGARSDQVLEVGMEVPAQPKDHPFVKLLTKYAQLVYAGRFDEPAVRELRDQLDQIRPDDPGLYDADAEIERQRLLAGIDLPPGAGQP